MVAPKWEQAQEGRNKLGGMCTLCRFLGFACDASDLAEMSKRFGSYAVYISDENYWSIGSGNISEGFH